MEINYSPSKPKKILFNHLPKCAGSSLNVYLKKQYLDNKIFIIEGSNPRRSVDLFKTLPKEQRCYYDLITGHNANELLDYVHPECIKITVFRDPIDRIISHYYYAKETKDHYLHSKIIESELNLEQQQFQDIIKEENLQKTYFYQVSVSTIKEEIV